mgnify:FL=1
MLFGCLNNNFPLDECTLRLNRIRFMGFRIKGGNQSEELGEATQYKVKFARSMS